MALESSELFGKMFQMALGQHIVRCPALLKYLDQSHISHEEFDFGFIRAVVLAAKNVLGVINRVPDEGVPLQLLMQQLGNMLRVGGFKVEEQDAVVSYVSNIYSQPIHPDYYIPMFQKFLEHQNILKAMKEVSIYEPDKIASTIQRAIDRSRVSSRRPIKPLVDHMTFERVIPIPCGLGTIDGPMMGGLGIKEYGILCAYTGVGKCLGKGTMVMKSDGSTIAVEDIKIGDLLMGPDSRPRRVMSTTTGFEEMFRVDQRNGDSYTCNRSHILSLKRTGHIQTSSGPGAKSVNRKGEIVNISVHDYLSKKSWFKHSYKGWKVAVDFAEKDLPMDPYILGVWLGDGTSAESSVTTGDRKIEEAVRAYAKQHSMKVRVRKEKGRCRTLFMSSNCDGHPSKNFRGNSQNHMKKTLSSLGVVNNKHIPQEYLTASRSQRLQLLAGLIDSAGRCPKRSVAIFTSERKELAENVMFLARSLGFMCSLKHKGTKIRSTGFAGHAYNVTICGDVHAIPTTLSRHRPKGNAQRNQLVSSFKLTSIGRGKYYGFTLDQDGLFLLGDFTVTHNTTAAINFGWGAARQGFKSCMATLELTGAKVTQRLYSLVARYSYEKIRQPEAFPDQSVQEIIDEYTARYRENSRGIAQNFQIWDFAGERCSVQLLTDWLHREQDEDPENPPQELLIDWLLCLDEDPGFNPRNMSSNEVRHKLQRYGDALSKLAINENIAIWATHQADAKAEGKDKISMAHSAEGKSAGWKCSTFLGIGASEENRKENLFTVSASKMRDGRLFSAQIYGALDQQRFEDRQIQSEEDPVDNRLSMAEDIARSQRTLISQGALSPT